MPYEDILAHAARILPVPPSQEALDDALQNTAATIPAGTPPQRVVSLMRHIETGDLRFFLDFNAADVMRRGDWERLGPPVFCRASTLTEWSAS